MVFNFIVYSHKRPKLLSELFSKIPLKGSEALYFFEIEESSIIAILHLSRYRKWRKIVHFLFARKDQRDNIYQCMYFEDIIAHVLVFLKHFDLEKLSCL